MSKKYLPGGAINPAWAKEQQVDYIANNITDGLWELFNSIGMELNLELSEGVNLKISNQNNTKDMCSVEDRGNMNDYLESKFNFIKNHSDTPEDLKLAREIIGLDNFTTD